jgi:hypothetical protein
MVFASPSESIPAVTKTRIGSGMKGGLHSHERVHLHSKCFLNAERHVPGKVSLAVKEAKNCLRQTIQAPSKDVPNGAAVAEEHQALLRMLSIALHLT